MSNKFLNAINENEEEKNESFKQEKFNAIKPDYKKYYILGLIVVVALVASFFLMNQKISMTNIVGWNLSDARDWASANKVQLVVYEIYDESEPQTILSQSVLEDEKVSANSSIEIEVSLGFDPKEVVALPNFDETWTKTKLLTWLEENGIENFTFTSVEDENLATGTFLSIETPESVSDYLREQSITFFVSILPVEEEIVVLDFLNYTTAQIDAWCAENDTSVSYAFNFSDTVAANKVLTQSVMAGEVINPNDRITITLSKGPAVSIVDFTNYDEAAAIAWAKEFGIELSVVHEYSNTVAKTVAIYQSIAKDQIVEGGTNLTLFYSLGSEVTIGSYVNQSLTTLQAFMDAQNELKANLTLNVTYSYSTSIAINKVISQNVKDSNIGIGTTINVIVSLGDLIEVPDFLALNTAKTFGLDANGDPLGTSALDMYNLVSTTCTSTGTICQIVFSDDDTNFGKVLSQSIEAGTETSDSNVVVVTIAN